MNVPSNNKKNRNKNTFSFGRNFTCTTSSSNLTNHDDIGSSSSSSTCEHQATPSKGGSLVVERHVDSSDSSPPTNYNNFGNAKITITKEDMRRYFNAPQILAARMLNVSVSTLKRRFYEMYDGRWPYQKLPTSERKKSIWFYINEEDESEKIFSKDCLRVLNLAFIDPTQSKAIFFPEEVKSDKPKKKDITFLTYIPQQGNSNMPRIQVEAPEGTYIKGGSRQKYSLVGIKKTTKKKSKKK